MSAKRPIIVTNWYLLGKELHWWVRNEQAPGAAGTSKGRDNHGMVGHFTGHTVTVAAWTRQSKTSWLITGTDGQIYLAQFSIHYRNGSYPHQCSRTPEVVETKLSQIVAAT
jgi:hypothetical protein